MSTLEVFRILDEAKERNFVSYLVWGGEPLLRTDSLEILKHAHELSLYTSLVTNGILLPEKASEIAKIADLTWVSLDHYSDYHDEMRGFKGAFKKAVEGIIRLRSKGGRIEINCVLSRLNMDSAANMAKLASDLGVRIAFDPMEVFPGINDEYALSRLESSRLFQEIFDLKKAGYPILNSFEYLRHLKSPVKYVCAQSKVFINISENGEVTPFWCRKEDNVIGDLHKQSLGEILCSPPYNEFARITEGCNLCNNSSLVEASMFYSIKGTLSNCFKPPVSNPIIRFIIDYGLQ